MESIPAGEYARPATPCSFSGYIPAMLAAGTLVDRYIIESVAGRGGMGVVYRVRHQVLGSTHALKVVERPVSGTAERFMREARAQARLRHPNVVSVTDYLEVLGLPALVMEWVEGRPLDRVLNDGPMPYVEIDRLFAEVCAGVMAAHELSMVHRDIKPANILVTEVDGLRTAKVTDFGIVKVSGDPTLTRSRSGMGTPGYMAPEQVFDAKRVDVRADVYSLGCLLYRMLCGAPPFRGELRALLACVARGEYPPPESVVPELPGNYVRAIRACLEPARELRPPSVAALRALLAEPLPPGGVGPPSPRNVDEATWRRSGGG